MGKKITTEDIINRCIETHGNLYDYSKVEYKGYSTKIEIICRKHGSFWQDARNYYKLGAGCPICANNMRKTLAQFIKEANERHNFQYDYSLVSYVNNKTKVNIICKKHGVFQQTPDKHLYGCGCPKCAADQRKVTMKERYGVECALQSDIIRQSMVNSLLDRYHVSNVMYLDRIKQAVNESKRKNNTFGRSQTENLLYGILCEHFDESDIIRQYSDDRYPFNCDFYVVHRDLFIELNAFWSHGGHWFNICDQDDIRKSEEWLNKKSKFYDTCYNVWTKVDVRKRNMSMNNKLNYIVFWDNSLVDAQKWFDLDCPNGHDYLKEYTWL